MLFTRGELQEISAGIRPAGVLKTITFNGGITSGKLSTKAAFTTTLTGANNDMVFTAATAGVAGNAITVTYRDPGLVSQTTAVRVDGTSIIVNLATDSGGVITSTASQVKTAFDANAGAAALVDSVANSGGDTGAGVVSATSFTLAGGSDGKVPLFTVTGSILCSLRGYCATSLTGTGATLVHGVTGTTNMLIPILTSTNITVGKGIDSTSAVVARGTALAKVPLWNVNDETIFATTATHSTDTGKINYILDWIGLTENASVV